MRHGRWSFKGGGALLWAIAIACLLLTPSEVYEKEWLEFDFRHTVDSIVHGVLFFVLAILVRRALTGGRPHARAMTTLGLCLVYAVLLEILQQPIPGRSFEIVDIVAAFLGILAALGRTMLPATTARREAAAEATTDRGG